MKVLLVTNGTPSAGFPEHGRFAFDQAQALKSAGVDVAVAAVDLCSLRHNRRIGFFSETKSGIPVYTASLPLGAVGPGIEARAGGFLFRRLLNRVQADFGRPDLLHAHFTLQGCMALPAAKENGIPLVLTEHSSLIRTAAEESKIYQCASRAYNGASLVISVSRSLAEIIRSKFGVRVEVVGNVVDAPLFCCSPFPSGEDYTFVCAANLVAIKRIELLIDAFSDAFGGDSGVKLRIFGDGPLRASLEKKLAALGPEANITLEGSRPRAEIAAALSQADCFALASDAETFGVAYIEALCAGRPVVATRCGGPEDFIDGSNGLIIPTGDRKALADALLYMRAHSREKYSPQSLADGALSRFSADAVARELIKRYNTLLNR